MCAASLYEATVSQVLWAFGPPRCGARTSARGSSLGDRVYEFNGRERFVAMARHVLVTRFDRQAARLREVAKSPIEEVALLGLFMAAADYSFSIYSWSEAANLMDYPVDTARPGVVSICAIPQYPHGPYVVDVAVNAIDEDDAQRRVGVFVELDGHDFHEKTKEQVAADKKRQRYLAKDGTVVLRFSGSEVFKDPEARMAEVIETVVAQLRRHP